MTGREDSGHVAGEPEVDLASPDDESDAGVTLIDLEPSSREKRIAGGAVAVLATAVVAVAPFAATPLPRFAAFIPFLNATILVTDLVTAILLFAQFSISRSRALLVLSGGYLFTALIVIPHALTYPGAFSPTGLLGAGLQTTAWLYLSWHLGFPMALLIYAWTKDEEYPVQAPIRFAIGGCVAVTSALVFVLVWIAIVWDAFLPRLFTSASDLTLLGNFSPVLDLVVCAVALASLWMRRRSVLDLWLMVVACALIGELAITVVRFSLGFYVSRVLSLLTSTIVLVILLAQTTELYTRLARANMMLRLERDNKLMNLEAVVASISHEVKQPLAAIVMRGSTALRFLSHAPPDLDKARLALNKIVSDGHRASQIFDNIRDLFRASDQQRVPVDVNEMVLGVLDTVQAELAEHRITVSTEPMAGSPLVSGHRGQLQEVLLNLIRNAIEAMATVADGSRVLRLRIERRDHEGIAIKVIDNGPGIDPAKLDSIFDAFVTTKSHGVGLGLAICRMIVERHGGQLTAASAPGGGAQFEITLPGKVVASAGSGSRAR
jgi:signal transduction histidine kinase